MLSHRWRLGCETRACSCSESYFLDRCKVYKRTQSTRYLRLLPALEWEATLAANLVALPDCNLLYKAQGSMR